MEKDLPKKKKKIRRKKRKKRQYFNKDTEIAILEFQDEPDAEKRKLVFVDKIKPSFSKLIENIVFVYKFHALGNIEILKNDCMSFLFESLYKYDRTKGHAAFSYFNVLCIHWFIQRVKTHKKKTKSDVPFDNAVLAELEEQNNQSVVISYEDELIKKEFMKILKEEMKSWREKFEKPQEKVILEAVILLLENPDLVSLYNKKGIYMYLREMGSMNTKQVVTNLAKLRKKYYNFKNKYLAGEL